ncbi:hypothetical protein B0H17DRAFT_1203564 [Mycena rosella]|uniref:Uncharacterized protein n=1 Tax=Mycena rosella TaxID=1033263 RepID=A0AAD7DBQ7_MYCRO|nr:hypothetical protein B0H17DRAFT_1203564 [Mycena rosella]
MEFVATSQPLQDGEDFWGLSAFSPGSATADACGDWSDVDFVGTSQPLEDGEDSWYSSSKVKIPTISPPRCLNSEMDCTPRSRLVRRVSPLTSTQLPVAALGITSRPLNLVRRVTIAPEIQKKRNRACREAQQIAKRIRALAKATAKLRRKHRVLCDFVRESGRKENVLDYL